MLLGKLGLVYLVVMAFMMMGCEKKPGGLTETFDYMMDYGVVHSAKHKGVVEVSYAFMGVAGPNKVRLKSEHENEGALNLEIYYFPSLEEVKVSESRHQMLYREAVELVREYVAASESVMIKTVKPIKEGQFEYYALDLRHPEKGETLGDFLVSRGLAFVNEELLDIADMHYLKKVQWRARNQKIGLWEKD